MKIKLYNNEFYGNRVSDYGLEHGRIDYKTLAQSGDAVLCNNIPQIDFSIFDNVENGELVDGNDDFVEIFQYFIIDNALAETLKYWTDEIVLYSNELDVYIWGVTHWGTGWDYVLTDIEIEQ